MEVPREALEPFMGMLRAFLVMLMEQFRAKTAWKSCFGGLGWLGCGLLWLPTWRLENRDRLHFSF